MSLLAAAILWWGNAGLYEALYAYPPPHFWQLLTWVGDSAVVVALLLLALPRRAAGQMLVFTLCVVLTGLVAQLLKQLVFADWVRPAHFFPQGAFLPGTPRAHSFPSGHSVTAYTAAVLLALRYPRLGWLWAGLAFAVAISRVYVGAHFPLDVAAGSLLGLLLTPLCYLPLQARLGHWVSACWGRVFRLLAVAAALLVLGLALL
ncbi:MAG: phosphatase PAP2 family protein [Bacteroidetes bacterium]|nr:phosphatase PAP2 family protein [Bacteroidota bacterium]